MVELRGVSKSFGSTVALHPTDLDFANGQTTVLIGPSGCGKSTLLRLIIGLIPPTSGNVLFDGEVVEERNLIEIRRRTGYVIQDGGLFPHLTALQNVALVASTMLRQEVAQQLATKAIEKNEGVRQGINDAVDSLSGPPMRMAGTPLRMPGGKLGTGVSQSAMNEPSRFQERVNYLAELVRIPHDLLSRYPGELSGGQRQRISLMRALMLEPKVLLLDEPLAALDPMVRAALQTDLKQIFEQLGTTVILVTHDMGEAAYLGQTIVLLREGKIVQIGKLEDFQKNPKEPFVTEFLNAQRSLVAI